MQYNLILDPILDPNLANYY